MKAIIHDEYGPPEDVLKLKDVDDPVLRDDEVLVRVHAAAVNWADWAATRGLPYIMRAVFGLRGPRNGVRRSDVAGTVEAVGRNVKLLRRGDEVFGWCTGAFAELVRAKEKNLAPKSASYVEQAERSMAGLCLQALWRRWEGVPGQRGPDQWVRWEALGRLPWIAKSLWWRSPACAGRNLMG